MLHINIQNREKVNTCVTATQTLLATARIQVKSANGDFENLRALIDSGSQNTIISEEADQILKLPKIKTKTKISGVYSTDTCVSKLEEVISDRGNNTAQINESFTHYRSELKLFIS